jgi:uncharacterized protein (UPF0305 family)
MRRLSSRVEHQWRLLTSRVRQEYLLSATAQFSDTVRSSRRNSDDGRVTATREANRQDSFNAVSSKRVFLEEVLLRSTSRNRNEMNK